MIKLGEMVMILDLHRQGLSVSAIARQACAVQQSIAQGFYATIASIDLSHLSLVSHSDVVTDLIDRAPRSALH